MADSKRQQIVTRIDLGLKTILVAAGYETNLGRNVYEWREEPLTKSKLPAAVWRETDRTVEATIGEHEHTLTVEIQLVATGASAPQTLRKMIADVVKMVGVNLTWNGLAEDTKPPVETVSSERDKSRVAGATLTFDVIYRTGRFDPYA